MAMPATDTAHLPEVVANPDFQKMQGVTFTQDTNGSKTSLAARRSSGSEDTAMTKMSKGTWDTSLSERSVIIKSRNPFDDQRGGPSLAGGRHQPTLRGSSSVSSLPLNRARTPIRRMDTIASEGTPESLKELQEHVAYTDPYNSEPSSATSGRRVTSSFLDNVSIITDPYGSERAYASQIYPDIIGVPPPAASMTNTSIKPSAPHRFHLVESEDGIFAYTSYPRCANYISRSKHTGGSAHEHIITSSLPPETSLATLNTIDAQILTGERVAQQPPNRPPIFHEEQHHPRYHRVCTLFVVATPGPYLDDRRRRRRACRRIRLEAVEHKRDEHEIGRCRYWVDVVRALMSRRTKPVPAVALSSSMG